MDGVELNEKVNSDLDFLKDVHAAWYDLTIIRTRVPNFNLSKALTQCLPSEWVRKIHLNPSQWDAVAATWHPVICLKKF